MKIRGKDIKPSLDIKLLKYANFNEIFRMHMHMSEKHIYVYERTSVEDHLAFLKVYFRDTYSGTPCNCM